MLNPNTAYENELYARFIVDPESVSPQWREYFKTYAPEKSESQKLVKQEQRQIQSIPDSSINSNGIDLAKGERLEPLSTIAARIAGNMQESLEIPPATSLRTMPVKALDENRRIINKHLLNIKRRKVSFTQLLAWAIVRGIVKYPHLNSSFAQVDGKSYKIIKESVNIGLAVDVTRKDGSRLLLVPNVKNAQELNFSDFIIAFDTIIDKARNNRIEPDDMIGTTITLTNPGMIGTTSSSPRLMKGQSMIVAAGAIEYPTEFQAVRHDLLTNLAVSKVVTLTNTYDHRLVQGAESADFLAYINKLLLGEERFYDHIFAALNIPFEPVRWTVDTPHSKFGMSAEAELIEKSAHVMLLINAYRVRGHLLASTNPLGNVSYYYPELDPSYYGFNIWDLDRLFHADDAWSKNNMPLRDIIELLRQTYCGSMSVEFMHIQDLTKKEWIKQMLEKPENRFDADSSKKKRIWQRIVEAEEFENFLHTKFVGHKRFSLEGGESVTVLLEEIFERAADNKLAAVTLGMAHRGRLTVLANNLGKDIGKIFDEFDGEYDLTRFQGSGDVKYHLGAKGIVKSASDNSIEVVLAPNPSHLEIVNPVVEGMARAIDDSIGDKTYSKALPVLIHGDSAFAGQGIVAETLNLSQLKGYRTGGTIHIILNNQIGFTTSVFDARSSVYASDVAKMIQSPILHVNGNDPEAVAAAAAFAFNFRQRFSGDIVIDMLCYRKYGHNESDEPSYTQPLLYKRIRSMKPVGKIYEEHLISEGILTEIEATEFYRSVQERLYSIYNARKAMQTIEPNDIAEQQPVFNSIIKEYPTAVAKERLLEIGEKLTTIPTSMNFKPNPKVKSVLKRRWEMLQSAEPAIDWSMAEALALGTLLNEGTPIRFSGEDSRRGTFSQRHAALIDIETEDEFIPLNNLSENQAPIGIFDSPLSELAVLGFDYGYSVIKEDALTLWEAQFGDFFNMAQPIYDQFISCSETKWGQTSNLVSLLPHGYDGMGPEHSSARIERFLSLCANENMLVCYLTSPAQYFHLLRRQMLIKPRKPLVLFTPKSALRHPLAVCSLDDLSNRNFMEIIDDESVQDKSLIKKLLFCSGKIYYELLEELNRNGIQGIAIIRIEQLYPLHLEKLGEIINSYENAEELCWVQEEPQNMGIWNYISPRIQSLVSINKKIRFIGRSESPATATGSYKIHIKEQKAIIDEALK